MCLSRCLVWYQIESGTFIHFFFNLGMSLNVFLIVVSVVVTMMTRLLSPMTHRPPCFDVKNLSTSSSWLMDLILSRLLIGHSSSNGLTTLLTRFHQLTARNEWLIDQWELSICVTWLRTSTYRPRFFYLDQPHLISCNPLGDTVSKFSTPSPNRNLP